MDAEPERRGPTATRLPPMPWGTTVINLTGSFTAELLSGLVVRGAVSEALRIVVGGGFLGSYTTFSTFTYETGRLLEEGKVRTALANLLTVPVGVAVASLGWTIAG